MPAIGDQVATLETDHAAALAQIDSLTAANAALTSANADLQKQLANAGAFTDEIKVMANAVATAALGLVTFSRTSPFAAPVLAASKPFAPPPSVTGATRLAPVVDAINAEILTADSGDAQPGLPPAAAPITSAAPMTAVRVTDMAWLGPVVTGEAEKIETATTGIFETVETEAVNGFKAVEAKIEEIPAAVDRMLHHSSAASTVIRAPVDLTMHVDHDEGGLPIFLRRGTTFDALARRDYLR